MLKIGIVGFGKMGRIRFDAVQADGRGTVIGVVEPGLKVAPAGVRIFGSAEELIRNPDIDAIFVCTPNYLNKRLTILCLKNGKHVFCEKPPAFNAKDVQEIIDAEVLSRDRKLMYGFNHRHHESLKQAKKMIDSGDYGKVLWMRGRYGKSVDQDFFSNWRSKRELTGGGILIDQGIHMLDLFLMFGQEFQEVHAFVSSLYWKLDVEDNVFAILRNKEGVVASLHSTMTQWRHLFSLEIFLEKGYIVLNGLLTSSGTYGEEVMTVAKNRTTAPAATWSDEEHFRYTVDTSWGSEVKHFLDSILENHPVAMGNSADALRLMKLVDQIYGNRDK